MRSTNTVYFGSGHTARILAVSEDFIRYVDSDGLEREIDLHACVKCGVEEMKLPEELKLVGWNKMDQAPRYIAFLGSVRMAFESAELAYHSLGRHLLRYGYSFLDGS